MTDTVEDLVKKFENVIPVQLKKIPMLMPDGSYTEHTIFFEDYAARDCIRSKMTDEELRAMRYIE